MDDLDGNIRRWKESLCKEISLAGLYNRSPTAHKWKALHRSIIIRESLFWRLTDLMEQAKLLIDHHHVLGARILIRSGLETVAVLIYLNQKTHQVLQEGTSFHDFSDITANLLLGSKDGSTPRSSINILTILENSEGQYPGILKMHQMLSESAHPNWEGIALGYYEIDHEEFVTNFRNKWGEITGKQQTDLILLCMDIFENEYQDIWPRLFKEMEKWIEEKDFFLEETKPND